MNVKKLTSAFLAAVMLSSAVSCGTVQPERGAAAVSASAAVYADWLTDRIGNSADGITVGIAEDAESYGVNLDSLRDEGFVIRKSGGDAVIFGKTEDGLDRGVRYFANYCTDTDEVNYTYGEGCKVKKLTIAGNDISEYSVYLADEDRDECHSLAASEIRKYIGDACGFYPEIVNTESQRMIVIDRITEDDPRYSTLGVEGFTISVENGNLYITGGTLRGCLYGVYEFLESYVGYCFLYDHKAFTGDLAPDSFAIDYLYEAEHIDIPEGTLDTQTPSFELRDNFCGLLTEKTPEYAVKMKGMNDGTYNNPLYNCYGINKVAIHGLSRNHFYQQYFDIPAVDLDSSQPCFIDADFIEASKEYAINRIQLLKNQGQVVADIDMSQLDSAIFCHCSDCMEYIALDGGYIGPVLYYTNIIADAVAEAYPGEDIYVDMFAYWGTSSVPKTTRPRDNINVSYCYYNDLHKSACYAHPAHGRDCDLDESVSNVIYGEEFEGWCEIANRVTVWYYPGAWGCSAIASPTFMNLREDFEYFASFENMYGMFICPGFGDSGQVDDLITFYLMHRLFWNADMSEEDYQGYIKEYMYIMFGDGYEYIYDALMEREKAIIDDCWTVMGFNTPTDRVNFGVTADRFEADITMFDRAAELACTAEQEERVLLLSRTMYFTGLVATHTEWYLEGDDESRARYTEIYNCFKELAISTEFRPDGRFSDIVTEESFNIEENIAVILEYTAPGKAHDWWNYEKYQ